MNFVKTETHPATAPLFIVNPLSGMGMDNLFSTHPSTENRIAALEALARQSGNFRQPSGFFAQAGASPWAGQRRGPWS